MWVGASSSSRAAVIAAILLALPVLGFALAAFEAGTVAHLEDSFRRAPTRIYARVLFVYG